MLRGVNKRIAPAVEKVLRSAIANAENKSDEVDVDKLFVTEAYVNEGPRHEADPARSDGPRVSVPAPDGAHRGQGWRERAEAGEE